MDSCSKASGSLFRAKPEPSYCNEFIRYTYVLLDVYADTREAIFYPELTADTKKTVAGCAVCEAFQSSMIRELLVSHVEATAGGRKSAWIYLLFKIRTT